MQIEITLKGVKKWWEKAIIYQIYPKSFYDSNNDGIGDIKGIISKLDYLKKLGVNTLWLNSIFMSPQIDNGYDVENYFEIDPIFGDIKDVENLINEAHKRDLKIVFDFVLNHTSSKHEWFKKALENPGSKYSDYYLFENEKPNNWGSFFGGSVWEKTKDGRYYFHLFDKEMPDLNWKNKEVRDEMLKVAKFWASKGIDGLRLDAFIHLGKADFNLQQEPINKDGVIAEAYYANLPVVHEYMKEFSENLKAEYPDLFFVGEASSADVNLACEYMHPNNHECDSVITFRYFEENDKPKYKELPTRFQHKEMNWPHFHETMDIWQEKLGEIGLPTLYWNNHDMARLINRFGSLEKRDASAKCLATLMYLQKGIPVLLYGEEIGMINHHAKSIDDIEESEALDFYKQALNFGLNKEETLLMVENNTRNASRGAMQWSNAKYAGFSNNKPWLGVNEEEKYNVQAEEQDENSILKYYQKLLKLKQSDLFTYGNYKRVNNDKLYVYERTYQNQKATIYCNLSEETVELNLKGKIVLAENYQNDNLLPYGAVVEVEEI